MLEPSAPLPPRVNTPPGSPSRAASRSPSLAIPLRCIICGRRPSREYVVERGCNAPATSYAPALAAIAVAVNSVRCHSSSTASMNSAPPSSSNRVSSGAPKSPQNSASAAHLAGRSLTKSNSRSENDSSSRRMLIQTLSIRRRRRRRFNIGGVLVESFNNPLTTVASWRRRPRPAPRRSRPPRAR